DADVLALAEQVLLVEEMKGKAEQRRLGRKSDVALVPADPDADDLFAFETASRHIAHVAHGGRVRSGKGTCQRKARDLLTFGEPVKILMLLCVGAELFNQLARSERIGHHHDDGGVRVTRGDLAKDD